MAHFNYEHFTIIEEEDVNLHVQRSAGFLIITKFAPSPQTPQDVPRFINRSALQGVIMNSTGVEFPLQNISHFFNDYVLITRSYDKASRILSVPYIQVGDHILAILAWTPDYGSTTLHLDDAIPLDAQIPARHPRAQGNHEALNLLISGMPPQFFVQCRRILPRIFTNMCHLRDVQVRSTDFSIWANVFAPRDSIPSVVYVAVHRVRAEDPYLSMWPIWICVDFLPPEDPRAIQARANTNGNCIYKRTLLH